MLWTDRAQNYCLLSNSFYKICLEKELKTLSRYVKFLFFLSDNVCPETEAIS